MKILQSWRSNDSVSVELAGVRGGADPPGDRDRQRLGIVGGVANGAARTIDLAGCARPGDLVRAREAMWRVASVKARTPVRVIRLVGADAGNRWQPCTLLEPFDRVQPVATTKAATTRPRVVSRSGWMRALAALIASAAPPRCPASAADAQVTLMPHQLVPLLAVLGGRASRLLLADTVGLGKTIQAALLVRELRTRGCADRVLVLVPPGLREQWQQELRHRTGLVASIVDARTLAARARELPPDVNPWRLPGITIASLDFVKQAGVRRGIDTIAWDVLIVDEAHSLTDGTDRIAIVDTLARHSRLVVLLTATPHHGSDEAFASLCRVGTVSAVEAVGDVDAAPAVDATHAGEAVEAVSAVAASTVASAGAHASMRDPIAVIRRTRSAVGLPTSRRIHVLRVTRTANERRLDALLMRYVQRVEAEHCVSADPCANRSAVTTASGARATGTTDADGQGYDLDTGRALALSVLIKRASSSASSLERSLRRRLELLEAACAPEVPHLVEGDMVEGGSLVEGTGQSSSEPYRRSTTHDSSQSLTPYPPFIPSNAYGWTTWSQASASPPSASESAVAATTAAKSPSVLSVLRSSTSPISSRSSPSPRSSPSSRASSAVQGALPFHIESPDDDAGALDRLDTRDAADDSVDSQPADLEPDGELGAPGLRDRRLERAWLKLLIAAAHNAARAESKARALVRWLRRSSEPALIYTEYRDTLEHVARVLEIASKDAPDISTKAPDISKGTKDSEGPQDRSRRWSCSCAIIHGGLGAEARRMALGRFASGDARLLLTTDAGGEGLNLQHRCRLVLNVELPWNPNRLEQRIGRVDRLGQTRIVHAVHLVAAGTAEEQMLDRLTGRVRRIAATLGDAPAVLNGVRHAHDGRSFDDDSLDRSSLVHDALEHGALDDRPTHHGSIDGGSTDEGATSDGSIGDGSTAGGSTSTSSLAHAVSRKGLGPALSCADATTIATAVRAIPASPAGSAGSTVPVGPVEPVEPVPAVPATSALSPAPLTPAVPLTPALPRADSVPRMAFQPRMLSLPSSGGAPGSPVFLDSPLSSASFPPAVPQIVSADDFPLASQGAPLPPPSSSLAALGSPGLHRSTTPASSSNDPDLIWIDDMSGASAVVDQLRLVRAAQARAWRVGRRPPPVPSDIRRTHGREASVAAARDDASSTTTASAGNTMGSAPRRHSRGNIDPLIALEDRAPLVGVVGRSSRTRERLGLPSSGLLCLWRARLSDDRERSRAPLLMSVFVACSIACGRGRAAVASFVGMTMERCRERVDAMLDRELDRMLARMRDDERAWHQRRAWRDAAIAASLSARTRGPVQPWLFESVSHASGMGGMGSRGGGNATANGSWSRLREGRLSGRYQGRTRQRAWPSETGTTSARARVDDRAADRPTRAGDQDMARPVREPATDRGAVIDTGSAIDRDAAVDGVAHGPPFDGDAAVARDRTLVLVLVVG